ncbi:MAG: hypothetical protein ACK5WW_03880 [Brevundimonas sp.]|jgi:hypothetical protein|uniref:hypothetical protein n=1 Tax=Brevundimonas sp. TaxID=1871086 RepID=UPI00391C0B26
MFEFGRDLRRLFSRHRPAEDLGWLELMPVAAVEAEARRLSGEALRAVAAHAAWLKTAAVWREHGRRRGRQDSLDRADAAVADALLAANGPGQKAAGRLAAVATLLARFDLSGGPETLEAARRLLDELQPAPTQALQAEAAVLHARVALRAGMLAAEATARRDALALADAAQVEGQAAGLPVPWLDELALERAGALLEAGLADRDARLLNQAGRDLRGLVEAAEPERRPLTRARGLALCGAGLGALARLAGHRDATRQAAAMVEAATDLFTADHSPLDWAAVLVARGDLERPPSLAHLKAVERLLSPDASILAAALRERRLEQEALTAEKAGDLGALERIEASLRRRLGARAAGVAEPPRAFDWVADQIALGHVAAARGRLLGRPSRLPRVALTEAAALAREEGAFGLAARAEALMG